MSRQFMLNPQAVNTLFAALAGQKDCALWICTLNYSQQLYLSQGFNEIWQRDPGIIYENQSVLQESVDVDDLGQALVHVTKRQDEIKTGHLSQAEQTLLYRIWRPDGELRWIKDRNFVVHNQAGEPAVLAGVAYAISPEEWNHCQRQQKDTVSQCVNMEIDFVNLIEKACLPYVTQPIKNLSLTESMTIQLDEQAYRVSAREMECLLYMIMGASAKQTGKKLGISHRTVETYIEQLKIKFNCHNKMALIGRLMNHPLLQQFLASQAWEKAEHKI